MSSPLDYNPNDEACRTCEAAKVCAKVWNEADYLALMDLMRQLGAEAGVALFMHLVDKVHMASFGTTDRDTYLGIPKVPRTDLN